MQRQEWLIFIVLLIIAAMAIAMNKPSVGLVTRQAATPIPTDGDGYVNCESQHGPACGGKCISPWNHLPGVCRTSNVGGGCSCVYIAPASPCVCPPVAGTVCSGCNAWTQTQCLAQQCAYATGNQICDANNPNLSHAQCIWTG